MSSQLPTYLTLALAFCSFIGIIFTVYHYFRNPQIKNDGDVSQLKSDFVDLERRFLELKETHLRKVENDLTSLTNVVNELSKSVIRLSTIIEERIPKKRK